MAAAGGERRDVMVALKQQQIDTAKEFVSAVVGAMKSDRGVHAETAIAGAARMAGTFLFRSFGFPLSDVEPGQAVMSDQANEQGPILVEVLSDTLTRLKIDLDRARLGDAPGPENQPQLSFLETQRLLEPEFTVIRNRHGLSGQEAAESGAVASALLIHHCLKILDPHVGFNIAAYGFVEGAKTAPDPVVL
jgi:hypothetical protein